MFSNSCFLTLCTKFSPSFLILWYCPSCLLIELCKLSPSSSSLRYPNVLCFAKKQGTSKVSSCILRQFYLENVLGICETPYKILWQIVFQLLSRTFYPKLSRHALNKYGKIQIYACETPVHVKLRFIVSDSYLE